MKRIAVIFLCGALIAGILSGCAGAAPSGQEETVPATTGALVQTEATEPTVPAETEPLTALTNDFRFALIAKDRIDQDWLDLESGVTKAAQDLGCEVVNMSPMVKDDAQQAEQIRNAVAEGFDAVLVTADDSDAVAAALKEANAAGMKIICVDMPAGAQADAEVNTDDRAAGETAGQAMIAELEEKGITEGSLGIIAVNGEAAFSAQREAGFREAFADTAYTLLETEYSEGDAAMACAIAEDYISQGVVGIFCCSEGCTAGAGSAAESSGKQMAVVGFGEEDHFSAMLEAGHLSAVLVRDYIAMGYESVEAACALLHGRDPDTVVSNTGVSVLTD